MKTQRSISREDERYLTRAAMEHRRLEAESQLRDGATPGQVAGTAGVSRTTVWRWQVRIREHRSLRSSRAPGRPCRLTPAQILKVREIYAAGPRAFGFQGKMFTTAEFAWAVQRELGVRYHADAMGRIMHKMGLPVRTRARKGKRQRVARKTSSVEAAPAGGSVREWLKEARKGAGA